MQAPTSTNTQSTQLTQAEPGRRLSLGEARSGQAQECPESLRLSPGRRGSAGDGEEALAGFRSPMGTPGRPDFVSPLSPHLATPFAAYVRTPVFAPRSGDPASSSASFHDADAPAGHSISNSDNNNSSNSNSSNSSRTQDRSEKSPQKGYERAAAKLRRHSSPHRKAAVSPPPGKLPASPLAAMGDRSLLSPNSAQRLREEERACARDSHQSPDSSDVSQESVENSPIGKLVRTTRGVFQPGLGLMIDPHPDDSARPARRSTAPANSRHVRAETGSGPDSPTVIFSECAGLIRALSFVPRLQIQKVAIAVNEFVNSLVDALPKRLHVMEKYKALELTLVATSATNNTGVSFFLSQLRGALQHMPDFRGCTELELDAVSHSRAELTRRALDFGKQVMEQARKN